MINVDTLLEKTDLVRLVERAGVQLRRYGDDFRGKCPFHGGDNPTAFVIYHNGNRQCWHSFTEGISGDALDFVQRQHHIGFIEAAKILADTAGIDLPGLTPEAAQHHRAQRAIRKNRQKVMQTAANYYRHTLAEDGGQDAIRYLKGRGFGPWLKKLQDDVQCLGYSDGGLRAHLEYAGIDLEDAKALGLLSERTNGATAMVDAIPNGYLVYIHTLHKEITYMAGRSITNNDPARKSRNLKAPRRPFWLRQTRNAPLLIVEGQACAITAWGWGYNALALCGTALDEREIAAIRRYNGAYLALDDDVGYGKLKKIADPIGPLAMVVRLSWHDLNDGLTQHNATAEQMSHALDNATAWIDVVIEHAAIAPPFQLPDELEHLAQLVAALPQGTRGRYTHTICTKRKLASRADFQRLIEEHIEEKSDTGGFEIHEGRLTHYGDPLCNFQATITHELTRDDGANTPQVLFTVTGLLDNGEPFPELTVEADEFANMKWINRWGARAIPYLAPSKNYVLRRAIQEISQFDLKRERVHTYTGWVVINGEHHFLTKSGAIGPESRDPNIRVDLGKNDLNRYALPAPPADPRPALQASLKFLDVGPLNVTVPLWLAMYAAPLTPINSLDAVLWIYGTTQSGKSTISHLALTHFGPDFVSGHKYRAPVDWISTVTAIEGALFSTKDAPVIIDDYAPQNGSASDARRLAKTAQRIIRSVGNRSARSRARADLTEQLDRPPRGLVISTAENPLVGQSTEGRMIYVPVEPGEVIPYQGMASELDRAQADGESGVYAQAMSAYIRWLAEHWADLEKEIPEQVSVESRIGRALFPAGQSRLADYYALFTVTGRVVLRAFNEMGAIDVGEMQVWEEANRQTIIDLLRNQGERVAAASPAIKFWIAISDLLAQQRIYFAPRKTVGYLPPERATLIGWYDEGHCYLLTNAALTEAKRYWEGLDERLDILTDAFRRILAQQGYVNQRADRQMERPTYINKETKRARTLWLNLDVVRQQAGIVLGSEENEV